jgi:hypothetical protein
MPYEDIMTYSATFDGKIHLLAMLLIANLLWHDSIILKAIF